MISRYLCWWPAARRSNAVYVNRPSAKNAAAARSIALLVLRKQPGDRCCISKRRIVGMRPSRSNAACVKSGKRERRFRVDFRESSDVRAISGVRT
jgi:hypothetical protein